MSTMAGRLKERKMMREKTQTKDLRLRGKGEQLHIGPRDWLARQL